MKKEQAERSPRGVPMPQTLEAWHELGTLYEAALLAAKKDNGELRSMLHNSQATILKLRNEKDELKEMAQGQAQLKILDYDIQEIYKPRIAELERDAEVWEASANSYYIKIKALTKDNERLQAQYDDIFRRAVCKESDKITIESQRRELLNLRKRVAMHNNTPKNLRKDFV